MELLTSAFVKTNEEYVTAGQDHYIRIWKDKPQKSLISELKGHSNDVTSIAISYDSKFMVSGSRDNTIRLWNYSQRTCVDTLLSQHTGTVTAVAFHPSNYTFVSASADGMIKLWKIDSDTCRYIGSIPFDESKTRSLKVPSATSP